MTRGPRQGWEQQLEHALRTGSIPHAWTTSRSTPRCVRCGELGVLTAVGRTSTATVFACAACLPETRRVVAAHGGGRATPAPGRE